MNHQPDADSKENRLTCHPVGRPLSAVGLGNAESQAGAEAALSDNDLLSRPRTSNHKKNQKQSPVSPVCPASPAVGRAARQSPCEPPPVPSLIREGQGGFQLAGRAVVTLPDNELQNLPLSLAAPAD